MAKKRNVRTAEVKKEHVKNGNKLLQFFVPKQRKSAKENRVKVSVLKNSNSCQTVMILQIQDATVKKSYMY
jgi:hypothetical protein